MARSVRSRTLHRLEGDWRARTARHLRTLVITHDDRCCETARAKVTPVIIDLAMGSMPVVKSCSG
ncbi:MAG: hypothetical protein DWH97_04220 [Planctomycetota bacterium]|nr:MAG: hypothetical protein DWH97_04220 [Planctomycetota bacterium]